MSQVQFAPTVSDDIRLAQKMLIGGDWVSAISGRTLPVYDPADGRLIVEVPDGDAYIMKHIIHDWDDERALSILKKCRAAMGGTERLLVIEPVVPSGNTESFNKLVDLMMLVWTSGGKERTESEHRILLAAAGFTKMRFVPTASPLVIIEAM